MSPINLSKSIGLNTSSQVYPDEHLVEYINLKLASMGCPAVNIKTDSPFKDVTESLIAKHREQERLLSTYLCPADWRVQQWLNKFLGDTGDVPRLPSKSFVLDRHGVARTLSLPLEGDEFKSDIIHSYRIRQGVLHNPVNDRRTTKGVFHIADGGFPVPGRQDCCASEDFQSHAWICPAATLFTDGITLHQRTGGKGGVFCFAFATAACCARSAWCDRGKTK